jgi:solute carrier family 35 (adenosine 3'-phospho 5'-phosphosulfate transporter), member B2
VWLQIWGTLILRKQYRGEQYMQAAVVMAGCFLFLTSGEIRPRRGADNGSSLYGILLMMGYLAFDGFTSTFQDKLFKGYSMSTYNQSLYTTASAMVLSISGRASNPNPKTPLTSTPLASLHLEY